MGPLALFLLAAGGTAGTVALVKHHQSKKETQPLGGKPLPSATPALPHMQLPSVGPAPPPAPPQPHQLGGDPVVVQPGRRYWAALGTSGAASLAASESRVTSEAENRGFTNVRASKARPAGWPGNASANWYVEATFSHSPTSFPRSQGNFLGHVTINDAWEA